MLRIRHNPTHLGGKAALTFKSVLFLLQEARWQNVEPLANPFIATDENNSGYRIFIKGGPHTIICFLTCSFKFCLSSIIAAPAHFLLFLWPWPRCQCLSSFVLSPAQPPSPNPYPPLYRGNRDPRLHHPYIMWGRSMFVCEYVSMYVCTRTGVSNSFSPEATSA